MPEPGRDHSPIVRFQELFGKPLGRRRRLLPVLARRASQYRPGGDVGRSHGRERGLAAHSRFVYLGGVRVSGGVNPPGAEVTGRSAAW